MRIMLVDGILNLKHGCFQDTPFWESLNNKDHNISGSVLGPLIY